MGEEGSGLNRQSVVAIDDENENVGGSKEMQRKSICCYVL